MARVSASPSCTEPGRITWKPRLPAPEPSAWIETAASAFASLPIRARSSTHGPNGRSPSWVSFTVAPCASRRVRSRWATSRVNFASGQPASVAVPVVSHSFQCVPTFTLRLMSDGCWKLPGLWPGSMTTTFPLRGPSPGRRARASRRRRRRSGPSGWPTGRCPWAPWRRRPRRPRRPVTTPPASAHRPRGPRRRRRPGRRPPRTRPIRAARPAPGRRSPRSAGGAAGSGGAGVVRSPGLCTTRQRL